MKEQENPKAASSHTKQEDDLVTAFVHTAVKSLFYDCDRKIGLNAADPTCDPEVAQTLVRVAIQKLVLGLAREYGLDASAALDAAGEIVSAAMSELANKSNPTKVSPRKYPAASTLRNKPPLIPEADLKGLTLEELQNREMLRTKGRRVPPRNTSE